MKKNLSIRELAAVASMLFGLFFGAGNLIFPVHMGQMAGSACLGAIVGFIVTGVGMPLLGVAAMGISRSDGLLEMARPIGKKYATFFTCALYLTLGPFFAVPRCATTTFTVGIEPVIPENMKSILLLGFSVFFFALVLFFSIRPSGILTWIGKIINPVFLVLLGVLLVRCFVSPMGHIKEIAPEPAYEANSFFSGFIEGYNTMDALAALAFGIIVINVIRDLGITEPEAVAKNTIKAGIFSCILMGIIYTFTTLMGAQSRGVFAISDNGGIALTQISNYYFGGAGQLFLACTVFFACLKTAIGLTTGCAETFEKIFPKVSYKAWAVIFSLLPLLIANLGLTTLIKYAIPVLMFLYPLTITLILLNVFGKAFKYSRCVFIAVTIPTLLAAVIDFLNAMPDGFKAFTRADVVLDLGEKFLPLFSLGLGWLMPAAAGLVVGAIIYISKGSKGSSTLDI